MFTEGVDQEESDNELPTTISSAAANEIFSIVKGTRSDLDGDNKVDDKLRRELSELLDNFLFTVEDDNPKMVRSSWLGVKLSFATFKKFVNQLEKIEEVLKRFSLI